LRTAWDLDGLEIAYHEFIGRFAKASPHGPEAVFVDDAQLSHAWRRFLFLDPGLPGEVLPRDWPGQRAYEVFQERNARWRPIAHEYVMALEARVNASVSQA
jgi:phenylacetic acid degradation operon negative regulatory protein